MRHQDGDAMNTQNAESIFLECVCLAAASSQKRDRPDLKTEGDPVRVFLGELFRLWFFEHGAAYYFVFRKDASETNIQFAELLRLISREVFPQPQYASHSDFRAALQQIIGDCFDMNELTAGPKYQDRFRDTYLPLIENTIVVDAFHGSSAVYIPPGRIVTPERIIGLSGYIHSAGRLVGVRDMQKATIEHFSHRYSRFVEKYRDDASFPLSKVASIFSVESYSEEHSYYELEPRQQQAKLAYDRERRVNGLYGLMLSSAKCHLGGMQVKDAFREILAAAPHALVVHDPVVDGEDVESPSMLWLLCDGKLQPDMRKSNDKRYYVLYQQLWRNANQFIVFDEGMPGWKANETIPHSLVSAALNLALPSRPELKAVSSVSLIDPFVGTGTTVLQCLKYDHIDGRGSDLSALSGALFRDNLTIASLYKDEIESLQRAFESTMKKKSKFDTLVRRCHSLLEAEHIDGNEHPWLSLLQEQENLVSRLIVHLSRRSYRRSGKADDLISEIIQRALPALFVRLKKLAETVPARDTEVTAVPACHLCTYAGVGYTHVAIHPSRLRCELEQGEIRISEQALTTTSNLKNFDILVADPPYDFNVGNDQCYVLLKVLVDRIVERINSNGAIVIFLPDRSYTGKRLSPAVSAFTFIGQLLTSVGNNPELQLYNEVDRVPSPSVAYRGPFYWRAPRTLDRVALIFRFRRRKFDS